MARGRSRRRASAHGGPLSSEELTIAALTLGMLTDQWGARMAAGERGELALEEIELTLRVERRAFDGLVAGACARLGGRLRSEPLLDGPEPRVRLACGRRSAEVALPYPGDLTTAVTPAGIAAAMRPYERAAREPLEAAAAELLRPEGRRGSIRQAMRSGR